MHPRTFLGILLFSAAVPLQAQEKSIAITVDDVPIAAYRTLRPIEAIEANQKLVEAFLKFRAPAIGFVNDDKVVAATDAESGISILRTWLKNGFELGNHNFGHVGLHGHSVRENMDAVLKGEAISKTLSQKYSSPYRYYRHPYTQTGNTESDRQEFEDFLGGRNYTVAPFTIEYDDYVYACIYDRTENPRQKAKIRSDYLSHMKESVRTFERMSSELFQRQIPQILLVHDSNLNADTMSEQLSFLESNGYRFISLAQALQDSAYKAPTAPSKKFGPSWIARWARQQHIKLSAYGQDDPPAEILETAKSLGCG